MTKIQNTKHYDLEERTSEFARRCRVFVKILPKTIGNIEDGKQLIIPLRNHFAINWYIPTVAFKMTTKLLEQSNLAK